MLPPPLLGAIVPDPTEDEFRNPQGGEAELNERLMGSNAFDELAGDDEQGKIRVRFKKR